MKHGNSFLTVTDMFCGAGGSSQGARAAGLTPRIALNHWKRAIETHNSNFPDTDHDCTDVQACNPRRYPSTDILLASPECPYHSPAKGVSRKHAGQGSLFGGEIDPAAERSRATMWDVPRFTEVHRYRAIVVENVPEVLRWECWDAWLHAMDALGYHHRALYLNSQFFGVAQSRDRVYVVFWRKGNPAPDLDFRPVAHCEQDGQVNSVQVWKKTSRQWGRYGRNGQYLYCCPKCGQEVLPPVVPAAAAIDWTLPAQRIGDRKTPLKPKTIVRIQSGLQRFAGRHLIIGNYSPGWARPTDQSPFGTVTTSDHHSVCTVPEPFLTSYYGSGGATRISQPVPTVSTVDRFGMVCPPFVVQTTRPAAENERKTFPTDAPLPTQTARAELGVCLPLLNLPLIIQMRSGQTAQSVTEPLSTVTAHAVNHYLLSQPETPKLEECGFRMLEPHEIQSAMAFARDYRVMGNKREKTRQLGNAVTPPVMRWIVERIVASLEKNR